METSLELPSGEEIQNPKPEDIDRALALPRDDDWYLELWQGEEDNLDVSWSEGKLELGCFVGEKYERSTSHIDEALVRAMLVDFAAGGSAWRGMATWAVPPKVSPPGPNFKSPMAIAGIVFAVAMVGSILFGSGALTVTVFALAFPGIIALAAYMKLLDVKRAAKWTKASGKVVRAEMVSKNVNGKPMQVPDIEYEFNIGMDFNKIRGNRVNLAEIIGPEEAKRIMGQYRVGTPVAVYYDPANPKQSVIERDMPQSVFYAGFGFAAVLALIIIACAWWFLPR